jgi:curli biogenesis system outer membrane secretion channel CsgG
VNDKQRYVAVVVAAAVVLLSACSSTPSRPTQWVNLGWAKMSVKQAQAECQAEVNRIPPKADYNPLANAYLSLSHVQDCMRAKGWEEQ